MGIKTKKCTKCGEIKSLDDFHRDGTKKGGYYSSCKVCQKKYRKEYYDRHRDEAILYAKEWGKKNPDKRKEYQKNYRCGSREMLNERGEKYRQENREIIRKKGREYYHRTKERFREKFKEKWRLYYCEHKDALAERAKEYHKTAEFKLWRKKRRAQISLTPRYKIDNAMRAAIYECLKGEKAGRKWEKLAGYSLSELMGHLEEQFDEKMTWQNYGPYWHIDHKIPKSWFNYETSEDLGFKNCWALKNLQPLEATENISKNNRYVSL